MNKSSLNSSDSIQREFVFLVDKSASMSKSEIDKLRQTLSIFLKNLPLHSIFNFVKVGYNQEYLFPKSILSTKENIEKAVT